MPICPEFYKNHRASDAKWKKNISLSDAFKNSTTHLPVEKRNKVRSEKS